MRFLLSFGGIIDLRFGILTSPQHNGVVQGIQAGMVWAADLGCVSGPDYVKRIDYDAAHHWLESTMRAYCDTCLFIAGGDAVGDAVETLELYQAFRSRFIHWPVAYVAQDGSEDLPMPDDNVCVFIGGSTEWKLSSGARQVIKRGQEMGKHIHIGRVNWLKRYQAFRVLKGSEHFTCDGTRQRFDGVAKTKEAWDGYMAQRPLIQL